MYVVMLYAVSENWLIFVTARTAQMHPACITQYL